jgi:RHS repeat-associated protein
MSYKQDINPSDMDAYGGTPPGATYTPPQNGQSGYFTGAHIQIKVRAPRIQTVTRVEVTIRRRSLAGAACYITAYNRAGVPIGQSVVWTPTYYYADEPQHLAVGVNWPGVAYIIFHVIGASAFGDDDIADFYGGSIFYLKSFRSRHTSLWCRSKSFFARRIRQFWAPIDLYGGEKREHAVDLSLNSPAGLFSFERSYRQGQQTDTAYRQILGLGWTHNHHVYVDDSAMNSEDLLKVYMPDGGWMEFDRDPNDADRFNAAEGASSYILVDDQSQTARYSLEATENRFVFDADGRLVSDERANNEVWTYSYYDNTSFAEGLLKEVDDGYGRKLRFSYIDNPTGVDHLLLHRVGDQTAAGLGTGSPTGHFLSFAYTENKMEDPNDPGEIIAGGKALLSQVTDVRGITTVYDYETADLDSLNFLRRQTVLDVDTDGDGIADSDIIVKELDYDMNNGAVNRIVESLGQQGASPFAQEVELEFQADGKNQTLETIAGRSQRHIFIDENFIGSINPAEEKGFSYQDESFRPYYQEDAKGQVTDLSWSSDGETLDAVKDVLGHETNFDYDAQNRLISAIDAEGRETEYIYGDSNVPRQPTVIRVLDGSTVLRRQEFEYDSKGRTISEKLISPADETTVLQETERVYGTSSGQTDFGLLQSVTVKDLLEPSNDSSTVYSYDAQGRVIKTQKTSLMGTCQFNYTVYDAAGNVTGTACGLINQTPAPTDLTGLLALYDANHASKKHTRITTHLYDEMGRRVQTTSNDGSSFARSSRTIYDAMGRVIRSIQNYVPQGSSAPANWVWRTVSGVYAWRLSAVDDTIVSHGSNLDENILGDTEYNARGLVSRRRDVLGRVTLYGYDLADRLVKTVQNASQPNYDNSYATGDPDLSGYVPGSGADMDVISEQAYDANGNLVWSKDARGSVTLTAFDALNRSVKVITNASQPEYDIWEDSDLSEYILSTDPDKDMVSTSEYDAMGRLIRSQRLLENRDGEVWDTSLNGYDALGRQLRSIQHASQANYDLAADPDLSAYVLSSDADVDIMTETVYDVQGRVLETIDLNGRKTRMVYDGLNRQVKTIRNYVAQGLSNPSDWIWDAGQSRWEDGAGNAINHGAGFDQNIISETIYDSDGRVEASRNIEGLLSRTAFDAAGRQALSIQNYVEQGGTNPANWLWTNNQWEDGTNNAVDRGIGFDQNIISQPSYDEENRAFQTRDARGNLSRQVYDEAGRVMMSIQNYVPQGSSQPEDWIWDAGQNRWEDGAGNAIDFGADNDQNRIQSSEFDLLGRVYRSRDALGSESYTVFDALGRVSKRIQNYVQQGPSLPDDWIWDAAQARWEDGASNAINHGADFDQNIISETVYNQAGQVVSSRDARGTVSSFTYDAAGRRLTTTQALGTPLATSSYACYDKAGRSLRQIANYEALLDEDGQPISPDSWLANGVWAFNPAEHGAEDDMNLVTESRYDRASRRIQSLDPMGNILATEYAKDGQVLSVTDPEGMVSAYAYDALRRRTLVVQNYIPQGSSLIQNWLWDAGQNRWEDGANNAIQHGINNDQNIIVQVAYDIAGRVVSQREPRGNLTSYAFDKLGRRTSLTNPLSKVWGSSYSEANGATQTSMAYPNGYSVQRHFDRFGRLKTLDYGNAANTANVDFSYDLAGNRLSMVENDGTSDIRITGYSYDKANRLKQVDFDTDADTVVEEAVSYAYDVAGLRTRLTMPGGLEIIYSYDAKGRLIALEDWDAQSSRFSYDKANRHIFSERPNGQLSRYQHDAGGRLKILRHEDAQKQSLAEFRYMVDKRGNRTQALELLKIPNAPVTTRTVSHTDGRILYKGSWMNAGSQHESLQPDASLALTFVGNLNIELLIGTGPNHSIFDLYLDGTLYDSVDAYAASNGSRQLDLHLEGDGWHLLELRNRPEKNLQSTGYKLAFQSLSVDTALQVSQIDYLYDGLSRLLEADYNAGQTVYAYGYDLAGNLVNNNGVTRTYNVTNQMTNDGTNTVTYDNNGNLTNDGLNSLTWDRANRLLSVGSTSYKYDGAGNRIQQTVSSVVTDYLNDVQPGLVKLLAETTSGNTSRYVHAPRGIHAMEDNAGAWLYYLQDGLGSVRNDDLSYSPMGVPSGAVDNFGFTGEYTDANGQLYLRARYYNPGAGIFNALDPFEGLTNRPMSLNGYSWVEGNVINATDPSGMLICSDMYAANNRDGFISCVRQVIDLHRTYEITLTDDVNLERWTSARVNNMYQAVLAIAAKYRSEGLEFKSIFMGTTQTIIDSEPTPYCAITPGRDNISWYNCQGYNNPYSQDNIIHEFGHILQNRAGNVNNHSMSATWDALERGSTLQEEIIANPGLGFATPLLRQNARSLQGLNPGDRTAEEVSDMFLFWVRGYGFSTGTSEDGLVGVLRQAFVDGVTVEFDAPPRNIGNVDNPGIVGWSEAAISRTSGAIPYETQFISNLVMPLQFLLGMDCLPGFPSMQFVI